MRHVTVHSLVLSIAIAASPVLAGDPGPVQAQPGSATTGPSEIRQQIQAELDHAVQRFEARDAAGVLAHVSAHYRTGPLTRPALREQLLAMYALCDAVRARVRIDEVQMVGDHAWVYSTGEVSGRLPVLGSWTSFLTWQRELEVARREGGRWRLFGYQQ